MTGKLNKTNLENLLTSGINELGLNLTSLQLSQLKAYMDLLIKWNKVYNLTAINSPVEIITSHLLDGLSIIKYFNPNSSILDVGSGMGVPGVILAIIYPTAKITLCDSNSKKTAFLLQTKIELGLNNLEVINQRVEALNQRYDIITSRAFANLSLLINLTRLLLKPKGKYLAMKADSANLELNELAAQYKSKLINLKVPYLNKTRFLIEVQV